MLHVSRPEKTPASLENVPLDEEERRWYYKDVRSELFSCFGHKCAYCEQPLTETSMVVDHFEPKEVNPTRRFDWQNIFLSCPDCHSAKGKQWPFFAGKPALLNPCDDRPESHFLYNGHGYINALNGDMRALITIETFNLNRPDLVVNRKQIYDFVAPIIEKTIAIEGQLPSVGQELFEKLKDLKRASIAGDKTEVKRHHTTLMEQLPANSNYRDFVQITLDSMDHIPTPSCV